jgi:superfamily I DNA and/or RNA helicase
MHFFLIVQAMKDVESLKGVLAQVVDNYQGEENDIILLSLVRSNEEKHIGFLKTENRVCVAMSRAKHALYIVGNMECLKNAAKVTPDENIWVKINATLQEQNAIGKELVLR